MKSIYVVGQDEFEVPLLHGLRGAEEMAFHSLLDVNEVVHADHYDIAHLLSKAWRVLADAELPPDAIIGYWDFPSLLMLPILRREWGLRTPTLESVLKCSHKYWSRCEQYASIPANTPPFAVVDPFAEGAAETPPLPYPFWIKPVCAHSSILGFKISNLEDFREALRIIRRHIGKLADPLNQILEYADLPQSVKSIDGYHCIAESIISSGHQCTLEGYVLEGDVRFHGAVDSLRTGIHHSSFSRYQYPSALPRSVYDRMAEISEVFMRQIGLDDSPFNIEFFFEPDTDRIMLLEVNPRISKSHSWLFHFVDGVANHQVSVDVALGRKPDMPFREGEYDCAAKFMIRRGDDAYVDAVPGREEVRAIESSVPGVKIAISVEPGMHLSHLLHQDSYTFEIARVFIGGAGVADIESKFARVEEQLDFRFVDTPESKAV